MFDSVTEDAAKRMPKRTPLAGLSPLKAVWLLLAPLAVFALKWFIWRSIWGMNILATTFLILFFAWLWLRRRPRHS